MTADVRVAVTHYMEQRRARGYRLVDEGVLLAAFADAVHAGGAGVITVDEAVAFATRRAEVVSRTTQARRLGVIRGFVEWLRATYPSAADPIPPGLIRAGYERKTPYLYSLDQVEQLMNAARELPARFVADAMGVLIGLLYVTGLRSGEAFALDVGDFDRSRLVLCVHAKLDRHRLVPVHPSTAERLDAYCAGRREGPLLAGHGGRRIAPSTVHSAFRSLVTTCELAPQPGTRPPRMHDFRHTLAVDALVDALRRGLDVDARLAVLSTFLGHADAFSTYWYLTASPELMSVVSDRVAAAMKQRLR
ncbi:MAG: tyrosine-type recombinase/integrase [Acidimicrobiales bacterium]